MRGAQRGDGRVRRAQRGHGLRGTGRTAKPGEPKQKTSCKNSLSLPRFLLRKVHLGGLERLGLNLTLSFIFPARNTSHGHEHMLEQLMRCIGISQNVTTTGWVRKRHGTPRHHLEGVRRPSTRAGSCGSPQNSASSHPRHFAPFPRQREPGTTMAPAVDGSWPFMGLPTPMGK